MRGSNKIQDKVKKKKQKKTNNNNKQTKNKFRFQKFVLMASRTVQKCKFG